MMAKPVKTLELHYPMIQLLITWLYLQNSQISKVLKDFRSKLSQHVVRQVPYKFDIENYGINVKKNTNMSKIPGEM